MRICSLFFASTLILPLTAPVMAQQPEGNLTIVYTLKAKPGAEKQLEEGAKKHAAWHQAQKDPWTWEVWQVSSGPDLGRIDYVTPGHTWKELDGREAMSQADGADYLDNMAPYVQSAAAYYYQLLPELSLLPSATTTPKVASVIHFYLKPGSEGAFAEAVRKAHEAIQKTKWIPSYLWLMLASGGDGPMWTLVMIRDSWAGLEPPQKAFPAMLQEALGSAEAEKILSAISGSIRSQSSFLAVYRADLSHVPSRQ